MDPPSTTLPSQPSQSPQRQRRRIKRVGESGEPVTKPKKVNSEIRKQQNRIASRNYREKRKRKLQYLQQLISDETEDKQRAESSPERQEVYALSRTASSSIAGPSSSPYQMPSHSNISCMNARSKASHDAILAATTASFNSPHVTTSQAYPVYPANWNAQMYSPTPPPPPPPPANTAWNIPSIWASGFEQPVQNSPQPSVYHYSPEPAPIGFAQTQPLSHQPQEYLSNAYLYGYNSFSGSQHQVTHNPHVSLPSSSPGYQGYRPRPQ